MGKRNDNHNVAVVRRAVKALGGKVLLVKNNGKHNNMRIETRDGIRFWMRVSQGTVDPFKQRGWVRQQVVHAAKHKQRR